MSRKILCIGIFQKLFNGDLNVSKNSILIFERPITKREEFRETVKWSQQLTAVDLLVSAEMKLLLESYWCILRY